MLRALIALALAGALAGSGTRHEATARRVVDASTGIAFELPRGWRAYDDPQNGSGAVMLSTYPVRRLGDIGETPPKSATWLLVFDGGPLWTLPGWKSQLRPLPSRLPPETGLEGFGSTRMVDFRFGGHHLTAYLKGDPRSAATIGILRSIRFTAFGRSLALDITSRIVDGVRVWRVGNRRSRRRIVVVGCPDIAAGCSGYAVTLRLVNGPAPLAADMTVIQLLRGREDVLARLERRLRPELTIRLGAVRDSDAETRRIVALAR